MEEIRNRERIRLRAIWRKIMRRISKHDFRLIFSSQKGLYICFAKKDRILVGKNDTAKIGRFEAAIEWEIDERR